MASVVRILAKMEGAAAVKSELEKVAKSSEGMAKRLRGGVALAAAGAGTALAAMAVQGIAGARESAQIHRVLESQIKGMGAAARTAFGGATTFAEKYGKQIGKDDDDILAVVNKLSTFPAAFKKGSLGAQGMERATKAAFDLQATGIGSAESNILAIGKAMDNPVKGMGALAKSGVSFTEQQKKQIASYAKAGKLAEAQKVLLKGIESNAKNAATAQADGLTRAKVALDGFAEGIATKALPYLDKFGAWFTDVGLPKLEQFGAWFGTVVVPKIQTAFETAKTITLGFVSVLSNPAVQAFGATILTVAAGVKTYSVVMTTVKAITTAWRTAQIALNLVLAANPVGLVVLAIAALAVGLVVAYKRSATFRAIVQSVGGALLTAGRKAVEFVKTAIKWIQDLPAKIRGTFASAKTMLADAGRNVINGFLDGLRKKWEDVKGWFAEKTASIPKLKGPPAKDAKLLYRNGVLTMDGYRRGLESAYGKTKATLKRFTTGIATQAIAAAKTQAANQRQVVADLVKSRNDYAAQIADSLRGGGITQILNERAADGTAVVRAFSDQLAAVRRFGAGIAALRKQGLGTSLVQQLVDGGMGSAGIVESLRAAGPAVLKQITALQAQINRESSGFGTSFAGAMFNGRITAAQAKAAAPVVLEVRSSGSKLDDLLVDLIRKSIRAKGGNVQVVLGSR